MKNLIHRNYYSDAEKILYFDAKNTMKKVMKNYNKSHLKRKAV